MTLLQLAIQNGHEATIMPLLAADAVVFAGDAQRARAQGQARVADAIALHREGQLRWTGLRCAWIEVVLSWSNRMADVEASAPGDSSKKQR